MKIIKIDDTCICRFKYIGKYFRIVCHYNESVPYIIQQDAEDILEIKNLAALIESADSIALLETKIKNKNKRFIRIISYSAIKKLAETTSEKSIYYFNDFLNKKVFQKKSFFMKFLDLFKNTFRIKGGN